MTLAMFQDRVRHMITEGKHRVELGMTVMYKNGRPLDQQVEELVRNAALMVGKAQVLILDSWALEQCLSPAISLPTNRIRLVIIYQDTSDALFDRSRIGPGKIVGPNGRIIFISPTQEDSSDDLLQGAIKAASYHSVG